MFISLECGHCLNEVAHFQMNKERSHYGGNSTSLPLLQGSTFEMGVCVFLKGADWLARVSHWAKCVLTILNTVKMTK